jgi:heme/copper-type cytochrome/quinol oxidase subunit 2
VVAFTASGWTQVVVALSIFVPVILAAAITVWVLRTAKHDPDAQRLRRAQAEYRARRDAER